MPLPLLFRSLATLLVLMFLVAATALPALAAVEGGYTVSGITVDVTAASASDARARAMADGQARAARELLERLVDPADHARLPKLDEQTVLNLVRDVAVESEKSSAVRYIARLAVQFKPMAVRSLLRGAGVSFIEPAGRSVVILPVFRERPDAPPQLWEDGNPWRVAWTGRVSMGGLVPVRLPLADLGNIGVLNAEQAAAEDPAAVGQMAQRQGVDEVLLVHAVVSPGQPPAVDVRLVRVSALPVAMVPEPQTLRVVADPGESLPALLEKAVRAVVARLEEDWRREGVQTPTAGTETPVEHTVMVPVASLEEWVVVRRTLARTRVVSGVRIQAMTRRMVQIALRHTGTEGQVTTALARSGLKLDTTGSVWTLAPARAE
ncbi:MAG: DUF2066 domain-containing protein [Alphaproteobacteria bacterium]